MSEIPSDTGDICSIVLDSGADAAVFPMQFAGCGDDPGETSARLHDAQGRVIPVETMRDVEVRLLDETGKRVLLKERVRRSLVPLFFASLVPLFFVSLVPLFFWYRHFSCKLPYKMVF